MSFLDEYLASIKYLPGEVTRSLELIGTLDGKVKRLSDELERLKTGFFRLQGKSDLQGRIEEVQKEISDLTDEKITIAKQLSEAVIKHKQRLESDLKKLERELGRGYEPEEASSQRRVPVRLTEDFTTYSLYEPEMPQDDMAGLDADNKKYCVCDQESFGSMISCDNKNVRTRQCEREWFHYECVGLVAQPRGAWFCPQCLEQGQS